MQPQLAAYIERGEVQFIYRHRFVVGPDSQVAAEAVECAADQGRFWGYHDKIFENQPRARQGAYSPKNLKRYAAQLGLDETTFNACIDSGTHTVRVLEQNQEAIKLGVQGTPAFLINGQFISGLPPVEDLLKLIDAELAKG